MAETIPTTLKSKTFANESQTMTKRKYIPPAEQPYISMTAAARLLGITRQRMFQFIQEGRFKSAYQADEGGGWIVLRSEVEQFAKKRSEGIDNR
jgi:predicted DNA-binding transcriptional regulator AlpA